MKCDNHIECKEYDDSVLCRMEELLWVLRSPASVLAILLRI